MRYSLKSLIRSRIYVLFARFLLGGVFIYASIDKLINPARFIQVVREYDILPEFAVSTVSSILPYAELLISIFLVVGLYVRESAILMSIFLILFMLVTGYITWNGTINTLADCGCFPSSSFLSSSNPLTILLRDGLFLLISFSILLNSSYRFSGKKSDQQFHATQNGRLYFIFYFDTDPGSISKNHVSRR